ncbi:MAG: tetratricopeptide repeat protein [Proteobacteria bacterium]|nr:tetratricopeptide repeat protein [Pseudomonadota bacterium]MBU4472283.1 tetratricopeptide repeat protein [Pseudomonadota bacterium]MCG2751979.1 tetratricopeptide repeat protein [Desulfobacteraceae bacterium]
MKLKKYFIPLITLILPLLLAVSSAYSSGNKESNEEDDFHKLGLDLFQQGYYELIPQGKVEEGMKKLDQAVRAFESAISLNDQRTESHWYLARIFSIQLKYEKAEKQYKRLIELEPENLDYYLFLASTYVQMKRFSEARKSLDYAKTRTEDTLAIEKIDALVKSIQDQAMNPDMK